MFGESRGAIAKNVSDIAASVAGFNALVYGLQVSTSYFKGYTLTLFHLSFLFNLIT